MKQITILLAEYQLAIVAFCGGILVCYYKTLKAILVSRCTKIKCLCISCDRTPITEQYVEEILEIGEGNEVLEAL
jgi:hypothetical protein